MTEETMMQRNARMICGDGAARFGESTEGQWRYLAQWAGFETWDECFQASLIVSALPPDLKPRDANPSQLAYAAVERRGIWEVNSKAYREARRVTFEECEEFRGLIEAHPNKRLRELGEKLLKAL